MGGYYEGIKCGMRRVVVGFESDLGFGMFLYLCVDFGWVGLFSFMGFLKLLDCFF